MQSFEQGGNNHRLNMEVDLQSLFGLHVSWCAQLYSLAETVERLNCKRPIPICRLFFKNWPVNGHCGIVFNRFYTVDWKYIHSLVGIFDPACELMPPWTKELYLCTVAPPSSLWPPPPLPTLNVLFIQTLSVWGGGGGWGVNCAVDHILLEFCTLFLTRCRTYQITPPPQTKWPVKRT
jgi:hypothetical protein